MANRELRLSRRKRVRLQPRLSSGRNIAASSLHFARSDCAGYLRRSKRSFAMRSAY